MAIKTGYKTAPQQHYRIKRNTRATMVVEISLENEIVDAVIVQCKSKLNSELQFKSIFYVDSDNGLVLQQYGDESRILFSEEIMDRSESLSLLRLKEESRILNLEDGALAHVTFYTSSKEIIVILSTFSCVLDEQSCYLLAKDLLFNTSEVVSEASNISYLQYANWQCQLVEEAAEFEEEIPVANNGFHGSNWLYPVTLNTEQKYSKKSKLFSDDSRGKLEQLSIETGCSVNAIFLSVFSVLCYRLNLANNAILGVQINGRYFDEIKSLKGVMSKTLPFYQDIKEEETIYDLIKISQKKLDALSERHPHYNENFEMASAIQFAYNKIEDPTKQLLDCDWVSPSETFGMRYEINHDEAYIEHKIRYNPNTLELSFVENVLDTINAFFESLFNNPELDVKTLKLNFNQEFIIRPEATYNVVKDATLHAVFNQVFSEMTQDIALKSSDTELTFGMLQSMASQVAHFIAPFTQKEGEGIAVILDQEIDFPAILIGIWMRGAYYIPIEPDCPEERIAEIIRDSGAKVLLSNKQRNIQGLKIPMLNWSMALWNKDWKPEPTWAPRKPESIAYMIYTSGTSGKPKGVLIPDSALINYTNWIDQRFHIGKGDVTSILSSYAFDLVYTALWGGLCNGAQINIPATDILQSAEALVDHIVNQKLTFAKLTPSHLKIIKEATNINNLENAALKYLFLGGEPIQIEDVKEFKKRAKQCRVINHYGPTETTIGVIFTELPDDIRTYSNKPWIGKPIANTIAFLLDLEDNPIGLGGIGELAISGHCLSSGYYNRPELNEEKFIQISLKEATFTVYKTGDLAYRDYNGNIVLMGRSDDQIKINGHRIEPKEIKESIKDINGVNDCHIQVINQNNSQRLLAFVKGPESIRENVLHTLKRQLPDYMIPECVFKDEFLYTGNGKIDGSLMTEVYLEGNSQKIVIEPTTPLEAAFSVLWKEVLGIDTISTEDNFFEIGGDSIRAIQLVSRMIKKGYKVEVRHLFEYPEVKLLAQFLEPEKKVITTKKEIQNKQEPFALSPLQEGMYYLSLITEKQTHIIQRQFQFTGKLDVERLSKIIKETSNEFPVLNSRFFMSELQIPMQEFDVDRTIPVNLYQLEDKSKEAQFFELEQAKKDQLKEGLDLSKDPLFKVDLWQTGVEEHQLLLTYHHIILDGWCFQILAKKIIEAYYSNTPISNDGAPPYSAFINWIQNRASKDDLQFWKTYLKDYSGTTMLKDYAFSANESKAYQYAVSEGTVNEDVFSALQAYCRTSQVTLGYILQQIWGLLLSKYTGREDVVFATTVSGRPPELVDSENTVGLFINTMPYRVQFESESSYNSWLKTASNVYPEWLSNQFVKLTDIQSLTTSKENLLKHLFVLENYPLRSSEMHDEASSLSIEQKGSAIHLNYELSLILYPEDDLKIQWIYNGKTYSEKFIRQLNNHYELLIKQLVDTPEIKLKKLVLCEQDTLISNAIEIPQSNKSNFLNKIETNLKLFKNNIAIKTDQARITYQELDEQSENLKLKLLNKFPNGGVIGIYSNQGIETIVSLLGALRAGMPYVPLDPKQARLRLQNIVEDADVNGILVDGALVEKSKELFVNSNCFTSGELLLNEQNIEKPNIVNPETEAYRIFTSGSTGRPKGCCIKHKHLYNLFTGTKRSFDLNSEDNWLMLHSFGFDFSVWEIYGALWSGASLFIPEANLGANPQRLKEVLKSNKITIFNTTPGVFYSLIDTETDYKEHWESTIRYTVFGGDKLEPYRLKNWWVNKDSSMMKLINMYGITETTVHVTYREITEHDIRSENRISPIGNPFDGVQLYCLDSYMNALPDGIIGELYVGGGGVCEGYYKDLELNKKSFFKHQYNNKLRIYKSGDMAFKAHNEFNYVGRADKQVQIRGFRIELEEIKKALLEHELIQDVGVIKKEGAVIEEDRIEVFLKLKDNNKMLASNELRGFLSNSLSWYMVPSKYNQVSDIPLSANGKLDLTIIDRFLINEEKIDKQENLSYIQYVILRMWQDLLGVKNIGLNDDFFDLGGNSLLAIRLITEINKKLKTKIDIGEIFSQRTIGLLSKCIDKGSFSQLTAPYQVFNSVKPKKVFFFPPAFAYGFVFARLALHLKDVEVITFNYIEHQDAIGQYVKFMIDLQDTGDFVVAGFSAGGSLAFEVTKALEAKGRCVSDIILLDSKMNKTAENFSDSQCEEIADHFLSDPRAEEYVSGEEQKKMMWNTIKKCVKFIHSLENNGKIDSNIHLITSDDNHGNLERINTWREAVNGSLYTYEGKGKHSEMLDTINFEENKDHFHAIINDLLK